MKWIVGTLGFFFWEAGTYSLFYSEPKVAAPLYAAAMLCTLSAGLLFRLDEIEKVGRHTVTQDGIDGEGESEGQQEDYEHR